MMRKSPEKRREGGVTFIELALTVAVTGMLMATISLIMRDGFRAWRSQKTRLEMIREARLTMDFIQREIHHGSAATAVISSCPSSQPLAPYSMLTFKRWDAGTWETSFCLEVRDDAEGNDVASVFFTRPVFPVEGQTTTVMARTQLATGVANFSTTYPSWRMTDRVQVNVGLMRHQYEGKVITHQLKEIVQFKNP